MTRNTAVSLLLERIRQEGNPLLEKGKATFYWQGRTAPALVDDIHDWEEHPQPLTRLSPGLWSITLKVPRDAYLEYAFYDLHTRERFPDPLNPNRVWNGVGDYNHYFYMPAAAPSPLCQRVRGVPAGEVTRHSLPVKDFAAGKERTVHLYRPPVKGPVPLLVVFDGSDYLKRGKLDILLDNLIDQKRIQPLALALVDNNEAARNLEYSCSDPTLGLLVECVLPLAKEHLDLEPVEKGRYGVLGASLGGLSALYTGMRLPKVFRKVLSQSGAFIVPEFEFVVVDLVRHLPRVDIEVWMDVGRLEWLLDGNRKMHALLQEKSYPVTYHEYTGGHNYTSWRNDLWRGLEALYPY